MAETTTTDDGLALWLAGLGFTQMGGEGWYVQNGCRVLVKGPKLSVFVMAAQPWHVRTEDAPRHVLAALLRSAGYGGSR